MREYKPHPLVFTGASEYMGVHSHACHSGSRDFLELRVFPRRPFGLVNLGFHFGRIGMRYVEVACVSTSLTHWFPQVPQNAWGYIRTHATPAPVISRSCASILKVPWA